MSIVIHIWTTENDHTAHKDVEIVVFCDIQCTLGQCASTTAMMTSIDNTTIELTTHHLHQYLNACSIVRKYFNLNTHKIRVRGPCHISLSKVHKLHLSGGRITVSVFERVIMGLRRRNESVELEGSGGEVSRTGIKCCLFLLSCPDGVSTRYDLGAEERDSREPFTV